jgi:hypothetical protein
MVFRCIPRGKYQIEEITTMQLNVQDLLNGQLNSGAISQMSQAIGANQQSTATAVEAALPMIIGAMARNASTPEGASSLSGALDRDHDGSVLDDVIGFLGGAAQGAGNGNGILGHVFGDRRPAVESGVSQASGLDMAQVSQLLMMLAPLVLGALGRTQRQEGLDSDGLAGLLGQQSQSMSNSPMMGVLSQILDRNNDGSMMDDVAGMLGGFLGGRR